MDNHFFDFLPDIFLPGGPPLKTVGIVAEYNPFHAGHARHIRETRRLFQEETAVVAVMSGNWVQRGECAIFDKWTRARAALEGGVDLVLELPTLWAVSSAEGFARGAVGLLRAAGVVDALSFGSESGRLEDLCQAAQALDSPPCRAALRAELDRGLPFAQARQNALTSVLGGRADLHREANDSLAVEYLRAAEGTLSPSAVLRQGAGHDGGDHPVYPSASFLREKIWAGELPAENPASLRLCERAVLARLRTMEPEDWSALPDSGGAEGLPQRLMSAARAASSLEEFYALAKTKRYAHARIRRLALWAFLNLEAQDRLEHIPYLRVLALNRRGREILRQVNKRGTLPVLAKPAHARRLSQPAKELMELEARCTDLYDLCFPELKKGGREWTQSPVYLPGR